MELHSRILVTGADGMAGKALIKELKAQGYNDVRGVDKKQYDLVYESDLLFTMYKPEYVFHLAARVGGIYANNTRPGQFIYENLMMQSQVFEFSRITEVKKLLFCGSACIYPKYAANPISENSLLTGELEETNRAYAVAKIAGVEMCRAYRKQYGCDFISVMPTNLYGENDNFHKTDSHVMPALIRKIYEAKINNEPVVKVWGNGEARREFLNVSDLAKGLIFCMNNYSEDTPINIGTGMDIEIKTLVNLIVKEVGYTGEIIWESEYLNGVKERRLDTSKINKLGWKAEIGVETGVKQTVEWFINNYENARK